VRIYKHVVDSGKSVDEHFVYRINSPTANIELSAVISALKKTVDGIFFDLLRAFGCVNDKMLVAKLEFYGIAGKLLNLMQSYL
jgi:hypothetical protein